MSPNPNYKEIEELHADHKMRSRDVSNYNANMHSVADRALRQPHHYFEKRVWACISMQKAGLILDFGCGNGMRTRKFYRMAGSYVVLIFPKNLLELQEKIVKTKVCWLNIILWMAKV